MVEAVAMGRRDLGALELAILADLASLLVLEFILVCLISFAFAFAFEFESWLEFLR